MLYFNINNMNFRKITFLICFSFFAIISIGQNNYEEVVYLKNGSVIHGVIIEQIPNISIKIKTYDGNIFAFKIDEIEKITKELPVTSKKNKSRQKGNLFFGIKAGLNLTDFTNNSGPYDEQLIPRFQASLVLRKCLTNVISFQPELQYSRQGFLIKINNPNLSNISITQNFVTEYLNLSPLFRFDLGKNQTKFILLVGPYLGFCVNGKSELLYDNQKFNYWVSDWSSYNRFEIGGSVGFGISHSFANNDQIVLDSRLSYGFNGISKNVDASNNRNNLYNSFSIGYLHSF
jgi:hypothetical protein